MYVVFVGGVLIGFCLLLSPVKVFHKLIKIKSIMIPLYTARASN